MKKPVLKLIQNDEETQIIDPSRQKRIRKSLSKIHKLMRELRKQTNAKRS